MAGFFITIPHSGELVPENVAWLKKLPEPVLMRDVDRYVDKLYQPIIEELKIPSLISECHRYVIDLNRKPEEFDADAVLGAPFPAGTHPKGLHWSITTFSERLIPTPMTAEVHDDLVKKYYIPFHNEVGNLAAKFGSDEIFHLDLHSMPSQGTGLHNDPGEKRADIVISDFHGKSARKDFVDMIIKAYEDAGFHVSYNWPYFGGGITQMYGRPEKKHHTVQVELNRALYMDEDTKKTKPAQFKEIQEKLAKAMRTISAAIPLL